jgi:hypothetical protein
VSACSRLAAAILTSGLALGACSRHEASQPSGQATGTAAPLQQHLAGGVAIGSNKSFAHITYRPEVRTIGRSGFLSTLVAASPDGHVLVFHNAPADIHALKSGDVLLIKSELARKVLGTEDHGAETYVVTDRARIADLVQDGEINIDAPLNFSAPHAAALAPVRPKSDLLGLLLPSAYAQNSSTEQIEQQAIQRSAEQQAGQQAAEEEKLANRLDLLKSAVGQVVSGWTVTQYQAMTEGDVLTYKLVLAKDTQGFVGKVGASGHVNNFQFWSDVKVTRGLISGISSGLNKVSGTLQFDWEIAKGTPGPWNIADPVKLPAALTVPLAPLLDGLPLTLEISSALLIHPALTGGNQVQSGGFTITLHGSMSASIAAGGAVPGDSSIDETFQITNDAGLSPVAPDAMVIAYAAPRFELQCNPFGSLEFLEQLKKASEAYESYSGIATAIAKKFAPQLLETWEKSGELVFNAVSSALKSSADVYAQLATTEGVVHSSAISMIPCSKKWIEFSGQVGTAADIGGMTPNAKHTATVFTKKFEKADPPSNFCQKVGN